MISVSTSKFSLDKAQVVLGTLLLVFLILLFITLTYIASNTRHDKEYISLAGESRVLSQSIVKDAVEASSANVEAFKLLKQTRNGFEQNLNKLLEGNSESGLPPSPGIVDESLSEVTALWNEYHRRPGQLGRNLTFLKTELN